MTDIATHVIDSRLQEALGQYFNGVMLRRTVGDCAVLTGVRKQNGAPVDIHTPSFAVCRDEAVVAEIGKAFQAYEKLASPHLQASERLLTSRAFRKSPALALLSCPEPVFDDGFDIRPADQRLRVFEEVLEGLADLHGAALVHGCLSEAAVRREDAAGPLRLTGFAFSGERATTITAQPVAYQSRHVVNTSQPRPVDDLHAAGVLGYRILMGRLGPERVLTGRAEEIDDQGLVSAILGEDSAAPTAEDLFPEGHPAAAQIARLLARMTGRLANAVPYSSAVTARKALASVLANPGAAPPEADSAPRPPPPLPAAGPAAPAGVSRGTALALFAGFLASTAAAVWFYSEATDLESRLIRAAGLYTELRDDMEAATAREAASGELLAALRAADRRVTEARVLGAPLASEGTATAYAEAEAGLAAADAARAAGDTETARYAADEAVAAADTALDQLAALATDMAASRAAAEEARARAVVSGGRSGADLGDPDAVDDSARASAAEGRLSAAIARWQEAAQGYEAVIAALRAEAEAAREEADAARRSLAAASGEPAFVLGSTYALRGRRALGAGAYRDASFLYRAALDAFADISGDS